MKAPRVPVELEIVALGERGVGVGTHAGAEVRVRAGAPGSRVRVALGKRRKGVWDARKLDVIRPAGEFADPECHQFGRCGGCTLQELTLPAQRRAKQAMVSRLVGDVGSLRVHPIRGDAAAYGYRNKLELGFGPRQWLAESERYASNEGRFLGFHAPGRFDRLVDAPRCSLAGARTSRAIEVVRPIALDALAPPPWDPRTHAGFWRHLVLRESAFGLLAGLFTAPASDADAGWARRALDALEAVADGVAWYENASVADVARGVVRERRGTALLEERLAGVPFQLSLESFFQTNTAGAEVLVQTVAEALGPRRPILVDLYCGVGTLGIALSGQSAHVIGIEEVAAAVDDARQNARTAGVSAEYHLGRVEDFMDRVPTGAAVVVDPPRAGLHPKAAKALADFRAPTLVYVACNPASLGRDRLMLEEGGWRATDLWTVDLFPQTGHVEAVMRFIRESW